MESQRRLETDLLSKFRSNTKPKLLASTALEQLRKDELKMGPIKKHQVINLADQNPKDQLCLEEYDDEEMLFFKDQIQNGTYVKP
jgi:beta-glucosidase/6-phospho-beta-glucosidase/beta-galactosidase